VTERPRNPRSGRNAPAPYQYQFNQAQAKPEERKRGAAAPPPPTAKRRFPIVRIILFALLMSGLIAAFLFSAQADEKLQALRQQRADIKAQHEKDLGYYVQMRRVSGYGELIDKYAQEFQVDRSFLSAVIARESGYRPGVDSGVGARGLMQVMEDTGTWIAGRLGVADYSYERLYEPELNIRFGAWYINYLSSQLGGNPVMVASAYHAGVNNVKIWALNYGTDQKTITLDQIPKENTKDYVAKVMKAYALFYEYDVSH
jgi:soluble lytic murein transglycosylase